MSRGSRRLATAGRPLLDRRGGAFSVRTNLVAHQVVNPHPDARTGYAAQRWLLVRRNQRTGELAFYRCWMPHPVPLATLVRVAGRRWTIETALAELKTTQRGPKQVLRSRSPELVAQEVWAHLLVHYALRAVMHTAALEEDLDPDRLSFIRTLRSSAAR